MMRTVLCVSFISAIAALPATAQSRFETGLFSWTPTVTLRDGGIDTNVFDEATDPKKDTIGVFVPQVDGILQLGTSKLSVSGAAEFVYFQRYSDERSINKRGAAKLEVPLTRLTPFAGFSYLDTRERQNAEVDLRAQRTDQDFSAGLTVHLTSRAGLELAGRGASSRYRAGQVEQGIDLATRFNRDTIGGAVRLRYDISPLTTFTADGDVARDEFVLSPEYNIDNLRVLAGLLFAPDAVIKGRAAIGYHKIRPQGALAFGYDGVSANVDLGYVLLGRTRFDARIGRDTTQSIEAEPYFLQTIYGGEVLHNLFGAVDVIGRASRETLDYPGLPARQIETDTLHVLRYGGAVAVRAADRLRFTVNYEFTERTGSTTTTRNFDRERIFTTITYGF